MKTTTVYEVCSKIGDETTSRYLASRGPAITAARALEGSEEVQSVRVYRAVIEVPPRMTLLYDALNGAPPSPKREALVYGSIDVDAIR